ncbi:Putative membrane protein, MmpL family [Mycobacteroides abscessus subsp. abscessus]|nr:Putative membrane protein, MmpL family [Mycobacteroides abscessus subsp. abscessus]
MKKKDESEADTGPIAAPVGAETFSARSRAFGRRVRNEFVVPFRRETYAGTSANAGQRRPLYARLLYGLSIPIVILWVLLACGLNAAGPQLEKVIEGHALSFLPDEASSVQALANMGKYFGNGGTNNFVAVLAEGDKPFGAEMHRYYADLMEKFKADNKHVITTIDLWSDPSFAPAFESRDRKASFSYLNLAGNMGTALAMESTQAVVSRLPTLGSLSERTIQYEAVGPAGTPATVSYLDDDGHNQNVDTVLPWQEALRTVEPSLVTSMVVQSNSSGVGCRITVDGKVRDEQVATASGGIASCKVQVA